MYYLHTTPGRLRIKIPQIKNKPRKCQKLEDLFTRKNGIESVSIKPITGSMVLEYDEDRIDSARILKALEKKGLFDKTKVVNSDAYIEKTGNRIGKACGRAVFGLAVGNVLEGSGLSFLAALI